MSASIFLFVGHCADKCEYESKQIPSDGVFWKQMDIEPHIVNKAVREILDKLVEELPDYRWEGLCTSSNGPGETTIELNIYRNGGSERLGQISYHLESGDVLDYRYRGHLGDEQASIVDLVLDIVNLERDRVQLEKEVE